MSFWKSPKCVLPRFRDIGSSYEYLNEEQRNVHIWNSRAESFDHSGAADRIQLVAGTHVEPQGARALDASTLYRWLKFLCEKTATVLDFEEDDGFENTRDFILYRIADPRAYNLPAVANLNPGDQVRSFQGHNPIILAGHYMMVRVGSTGLSAHKFMPRAPFLGRRRVSRSATGTSSAIKSGRVEQTRLHIRMRDMKCRVTAQAAPQRTRGVNFTGLEGAHIYPLHAAAQFEKVFPHDTRHSTALYKDNRYRMDIPKKPKSKEIDIVQNVILLRADIHAQFDAYEFSFDRRWVPGNTTRMQWVVRFFEKDGAASIIKDRALGLGVDNVLKYHGLLYAIRCSPRSSCSSSHPPPKYLALSSLKNRNLVHHFGEITKSEIWNNRRTVTLMAVPRCSHGAAAITASKVLIMMRSGGLIPPDSACMIPILNSCIY
ncbi:hypothetical protein FB45DRAFT_881820 [Roridomyces roridus]|uniref:HNH nuclease domain-containing protein n=1 Tax=Roridomyces roridus TaxID=1738132 RepID=A0AAD7F7R3_9AGAR|nr:hypothetical protein FB45DRAFT_881820 [Roridomyces roridus]